MRHESERHEGLLLCPSPRSHPGLKHRIQEHAPAPGERRGPPEGVPKIEAGGGFSQPLLASRGLAHGHTISYIKAVLRPRLSLGWRKLLITAGAPGPGPICSLHPTHCRKPG